MLAAMSKLSRVLLAVTIAVYVLLGIFPGVIREVIGSNMSGREHMVGGFIFLALVIVLVWAYAIRYFTRMRGAQSPSSHRNRRELLTEGYGALSSCSSEKIRYKKEMSQIEEELGRLRKQYEKYEAMLAEGQRDFMVDLD